jgi:hypothetical protein
MVYEWRPWLTTMIPKKRLMKAMIDRPIRMMRGM